MCHCTCSAHVKYRINLAPLTLAHAYSRRTVVDENREEERKNSNNNINVYK